MKDSYNKVLADKRLELGLKRRQFAKLLGINPFYYYLIECGYLKPNKKQVQNISNYLNEDYSTYLEGISSYPEELDLKEETKFGKRIHQVLGKKATKIFFLVFCIIFALQTITCYILEPIIKDHTERYYDEKYVQLVQDVRNNGLPSLSITDEFLSPQITLIKKDEKTNKTTANISIRTSNDNNKYNAIRYLATYWLDELGTRASFYLNPEEDIISGIMTVLIPEGGAEISINFTINEKDELNFDNAGFIEEMRKSEIDEEDIIVFQVFIAIHEGICDDYLINDFNNLIKEKTNSSLSITEALRLQGVGEDKQEQQINLVGGLRIVGFALLAINLFFFFYAVLYGVKDNSKRAFSNSDELLFPERNTAENIKKDWKFAPFLPETLFEIIGIILVSFGSIRIIHYFLAIAGAIPATQYNLVTYPKILLGYYMIGMFLLYFIDFDLFLNDRRVLRNIIMYALIFIVLYTINVEITEELESTDNIIFESLSKIMIPNVFMTVSCYFIIMLFLFFTPKRIKRKSSLIIYRSLAIIPIAYIIISYLLSHSDVVFGWNLPTRVRLLFTSEKPSFSILAIIYLVSYFFLRIFIKRKYGEEAASRIFVGNKFLFMKNMMVAIIILIIALSEHFLHLIPGIDKIGLGQYENIIFLAPIILFYHPHKGSRSLATDYTTLFFYFLAISFGYLFIIGFIILN